MRLYAYAKQMEVIREVIRKYGGELTQQDFDEEFCGFQRQIFHGLGVPVQGKHSFGPVCLGDDTPLLGEVFSGHHSWAMWLDLLQHMAAQGMITSEGRPPNLVYKVTESEVVTQ